MKMDFGRWATVLAQLVIAAPALVAAARPVVDAAKRPRA